MKLYDLLEKMQANLPYKQSPDESYIDSITALLSTYVEDIRKTDEGELHKLFESVNTTLSKRKLINSIREINKSIINIINQYQVGLPVKAYDELAKLFKNKKIKRHSKNDDKIKYDEHGFDWIAIQEGEIFYRMRIIKDVAEQNNLKPENIFHLPFSRCEKVSSARFSIAGHPSIYLSRSLETCHLELNEPQSDIYAGKFVVKGERNKFPLVLLDLTIPSFEEGMDDLNGIKFRFLLTYPVILACMFQVRKIDANFKPEYILPQLILQYIRQNADFKHQGVIYTSTKITKEKNKADNEYHNVVMPASVQIGFRKQFAYCPQLTSHFELSTPIRCEIPLTPDSQTGIDKQPCFRISPELKQ